LFDQAHPAAYSPFSRDRQNGEKRVAKEKAALRLGDHVRYGDFRDLVREMRQWQQAYFKDRSQVALQFAKQLEERVDKAIESRGLFDDDD